MIPLLALALLLAGCAQKPTTGYVLATMEHMQHATEREAVVGDKPPQGTCFPGAMYIDTSEPSLQLYVCTQAAWPWRKEQVIGRKPR